MEPTQWQHANLLLRDLRESGGFTDLARISTAIAALAHAVLAAAERYDDVTTRHEP